jgi:GntR family transcriptional regulator/MocR family aminotransferase
MTDDWAAFGIDLHLALDPRDKAASLADGIRDAIRSGRLTPGTRLPASRGLAADLGIARNTVAEVYALLTAEGWLAARTGAGTWVAARSAPAPVRPREHRSTAGRLDLRGGIPDASTFPRAEWAASVRRATQTAPADALGYAPPLGLPQLQTVLADYLARARGVIVDAGHVVAGRGFADLLTLVARTLVAGGARTIAVEQYGHATHRGVLAAAGLRLVPIPVDDEGADIAALEASHADAVLLTPAHQFPTGVPLSPARRVAVTGWARRTGALVLEDDYDGEFRYDRRAIGALQALDPEHVVYLGTASKSLAPAVGLAWAVAPTWMLPSLLETRRALGAGADALSQLALADFIASHRYDRHLRRLRAGYRRRREALDAAVAAFADAELRVSGLAAGLHCLLELPPGVTEEAVVRSAAARGVAVEGLGDYAAGDAGDTRAAIVVGYGAPPERLADEALRELLAAVADAAPRDAAREDTARQDTTRQDPAPRATTSADPA